jgi:hypothetical protein
MRSMVPLLIALPLPLLTSCGQSAKADAPPKPTETTTGTLMAQPRPEGAAAALQQDEPELRRGYGVVDMRYEPCVTAQGDQALRGEGCPSGFLIYGPYVNVPANSDVEVTFDVQPSQRVEVYADIVSQMAKQALAGLNPQVVDAGVTQRLGYRVHISNADQFVESRIGLRSATPVGFSISNYTMTVR